MQRMLSSCWMTGTATVMQRLRVPSAHPHPSGRGCSAGPQLLQRVKPNRCCTNACKCQAHSPGVGNATVNVN